MQNNTIRIDLSRIIKYILKHIWVPIIFGLLGMAAFYWYVSYRLPDTFTAQGTMYVYNANPNMINYQYASSGDLDSALQLIDTYLIVARSNKVLDVVTERLSSEYPGIQPGFISSTLSMESVSNTGVVKVGSTTRDPKMSADIANAVLDVAPAEIIRVVGAGSIEIIDYAEAPLRADSRRPLRRSMTGLVFGFALGCLVLLILLLMDKRVMDTTDLSENYNPPVLCSIRRIKGSLDSPDLLLTMDSPMDKVESYAKLRMNLFHVIKGKASHCVAITSAISGEGKSTIASNLAISCAMGGKNVLLVDGDLRRACQNEIFQMDSEICGISEILSGSRKWQDVVHKNIRERMDFIPAGTLISNPSEVLGSPQMAALMEELQKEYELVIIDLPPINIVSDPLTISPLVAGCLMVVRQNYTDQRDIRNALIAAEMTNMDVLGFVFYGETITQGSYYNRRYYRNYYRKYDSRRKSDSSTDGEKVSGKKEKESKKHEGT